VHLVGVGELWGRELPGLIGDAGGEELEGAGKGKSERMKIAWRYERLGEFGSVAGSRGGPPPCAVSVHRLNLKFWPSLKGPGG
jgi:elongator complex protein 4